MTPSNCSILGLLIRIVPISDPPHRSPGLFAVKRVPISDPPHRSPGLLAVKQVPTSDPPTVALVCSR